MSNLDKIAHLLADKLDKPALNQVVTLVKNDVEAAKNLWSSSQVRTRNWLVGGGVVVGAVVGFFIKTVMLW